MFFFVVVLTNPGNVLLPLLWTSSLAIGTLLIGLILIEMLDRSGRQSIRLPKFVSYRLPMLETRLNRMVPALLNIIRVAVFALFSQWSLTSLGWSICELSFVGTWRLGGFCACQRLSDRCDAVLRIHRHGVLGGLQTQPFVGDVPTSRSVTLLTLLRNAIAVTLLVVGVMVVLAELGMNIGPLLASAGVLGLAFSFGAQKMVEDIITGVFIQFENAMNVGDVVNVGGVIGTVEKLTVRSVTLRDLQGVVHMIPFSSAAMVSNYMREFSYYVCDMGVAYREDIGEVRQAMFDAFEELRGDPEYGKFLLEDMEWMGLNEFGASALVVRARLKTVPGEQWGVKRAYNVYLKEIFDDRNIEIPFPHQTVYFGEDKKGNAPVARVLVEQEDEQEDAGSARSSETRNPELILETPKPSEASTLVEQPFQIKPIAVLAEHRGSVCQLLARLPALLEGDLVRRPCLQTLPLLQRSDESFPRPEGSRECRYQARHSHGPSSGHPTDRRGDRVRAVS